MYHILIKRQILRLSNDMNNIRMDKRILLKINYKIENVFFSLISLASDISLNNFNDFF